MGQYKSVILLLLVYIYKLEINMLVLLFYWEKTIVFPEDGELQFCLPSSYINKTDIGLVDIERLRNLLDKVFFNFDSIVLVNPERQIQSQIYQVGF